MSIISDMESCVSLLCCAYPEEGTQQLGGPQQRGVTAHARRCQADSTLACAPAPARRAISLDMFGKILDLDLKWHLLRKTGEVTRIMDRGTNAIQSVLSTGADC